KAQAIGGFERGRGDRPARVRVQRVGGRSVKESALGQVERGPAGERAKNRRRRRTVGGGEREFVIASAVFGGTELQPQRFGRARERLALAIHDAVRRQRQAEEAAERRARGGVRIVERPPAFVVPRFEQRATQRERVRRKIERAL